MEENVAPVAASASMSCRVQSQISTSKPASAIRRTRSVMGRSRNIISAQTASRIGVAFPEGVPPYDAGHVERLPAALAGDGQPAPDHARRRRSGVSLAARRAMPGVQEAAMGLRPHRRNLVVWSHSAPPPARYGGLRLSPQQADPPVDTDRCAAHRHRTGRPGTGMRARWRSVLPGIVLTVAGFIMRGGQGGVLLLPGMLLILHALLIPASPDEDRVQLEHELREYSTPAQRRDLEAILDRYPDRHHRRAARHPRQASRGRRRQPLPVRRDGTEEGPQPALRFHAP